MPGVEPGPLGLHPSNANRYTTRGKLTNKLLKFILINNY